MKRIRKFLKILAGKKESPKPSAAYTLVNRETISAQNINGWSDLQVVAAQDLAYRSLIKQARDGNVRTDLKVASQAFTTIGLGNPAVLEVGCGSGYYNEIFSLLLKQDLRYFGIDRSPTMVELAKQNYPAKFFAVGDAARLPFADQSFDVVFNGVSLMHTIHYEQAIDESCRIARLWCIFHTVPVLQIRPTTVLKKTAYGAGDVIEIIFNEAELFTLFAKNDLTIISSEESIPYDLEAILNEKTVTKTYVCQVAQR